MGRIHDALKKAEEERKKKRAQKGQGDFSSAAPSVANLPEVEEAEPAKTTKRQQPAHPRSHSNPKPVEKTAVSEPARPSKKKGIAAGLQKASSTHLRRSEAKFGELLLAWHAPSDVRSEQIRSLRTNIVNLNPTPKTMAFVSSVGDEGANLAAANLAVSFAEDQSKSVLLVDANIRSGGLDGFFDVARDAPGFTDILRGKLDPNRAVLESGVPNLFLVNAGNEVSNPGGLLSATELKRIIADWSKRFDRVLIVLPPVGEANDAAVVGREVDGTVMVIKLGSTPRRETEHALDALSHSGVRVLGCVVTNAGAVKDPSESKS